MAYTINEIKELALSMLGAEDIDLTDTTAPNVQRINADYPLIKKALLESYKWRFATKTEKLADPDDVADFKYKYKFKFPADMRRFINLYSDQNRSSSIYDYEVQDGFLYTNNSEVHCTYIQTIDEEKMSDSFVILLATDIAIHHCFDFTGDAQLKQTLFTERQIRFKTAKNIDFSQKKTGVTRNYNVISVRG